MFGWNCAGERPEKKSKKEPFNPPVRFPIPDSPIQSELRCLLNYAIELDNKGYREYSKHIYQRMALILFDLSKDDANENFDIK